VSLRWFFNMSPLQTSDKGTSAGYKKKVPLGVNFTHYDNTQAAQHSKGEGLGMLKGVGFLPSALACREAKQKMCTS